MKEMLEQGRDRRARHEIDRSGLEYLEFICLRQSESSDDGEETRPHVVE